MSWTPLTASFFAVIGLMLAFMTIWEARSPSPTRRGLIPLSTTRGDRLFIGLLSAAYINLAWVGFTSIEQWWALAISVVVMALIGRFG
jgi:predicted small integral membrane protein